MPYTIVPTYTRVTHFTKYLWKTVVTETFFEPNWVMLGDRAITIYEIFIFFAAFSVIYLFLGNDLSNFFQLFFISRQLFITVTY